MAATNKPYEQFGSYVLFKKIDSDAVGDLWRAAKIDGETAGGLVALRRFRSSNLQALADGVAHAKNVVASLSGVSFVKNQVAGVVGVSPFLAHEYSGGRSLRHIVLRARGGNGFAANPVPLDQAVVIAERVALSLATTAELRYEGRRLTHGALLPHFVWIVDGEIRVAGQQLGNGLLAALFDSKVAAEIAPWFSPECRASGDAAKASDVFSLGALLYVLVTGQEPPDAMSSSAFDQAVRSARAMSSDPIPEEIRSIIAKSFTLDPGSRYASIAEMKQALSSLVHSGRFPATTFNLAFYVNTLLKKELEGEVLERDRESKVSLAAYAQQQAAEAEREPLLPAEAPAGRGMSAPLLAAAAVLAIALAGGAWFAFAGKGGSPPAATVARPAAAAVLPVAAPQHAAIVSQPLVAAVPPATASTPPVADDEAARKKAFEDAVQQKLHEEMMKLQAEYTTQLQRQKSKDAPVQVADTPAAPPARAVEPDRSSRESTSAVQLDQQRLAAMREAAPAPVQPSPAPVTAAPVVEQQPAVVTPAAPAPPAVREGDVVVVDELDTTPRVIQTVAPIYPPMALKQRVQSTVLLTALVSETGQVIDVKVLRGDKRFGFEEAAIRAVRSTRFAPGTKSGKRVKTWFPVPVAFKM